MKVNQILKKLNFYFIDDPDERDGAEATVLLLDIPEDAPTTTLKITIDAVRDNDPSTSKTHTSYIDIVPVGFFRTTMC